MLVVDVYRRIIYTPSPSTQVQVLAWRRPTTAKATDAPEDVLGAWVLEAVVREKARQIST